MSESAVKTRVRRVVTTEELKKLVEAGMTVRLPQVQRPTDDVLAHYESADVESLDVSAGEDHVVSVEYMRTEPVQCISVDHERHLYLTDDFLPTHNTSNIVFLKSTDDSMIETLQKMSGTTHRSYVDSKTVTQDKERLIKGFNVEGKVSYTMSTKEEPVIKYNDMAFISERNSIIFRAGDPPVWNRNETILPMSWRLFKDTIIHPGNDYSLQTIPTLSSALEFDVRQNQPNFMKMLERRMGQAEKAAMAKSVYQRAYDYSDFDVDRLDPDVYSDEVMGLIDALARADNMTEEDGAEFSDDDGFFFGDDADDVDASFMAAVEENTEVQHEIASREEADRHRAVKKFAGGTVSIEMLVGRDDSANHQLDRTVIGAYQASKGHLEKDVSNFSVHAGTLCGRDGTPFISRNDESSALAQANAAARDPDANTFSEGDVDVSELNELGTFTVHDGFYQFLAKLDSWSDLGGGSFEKEMTRRMNAV